MDNLSNEQIKELFYMSIDKYNDHMNNPKCGKLVKVLNASFLYKMSQAVVEIESGEKQEQAIPEHPEVAEHASAQIRNTPPHGFQTDGTFEGDTAADVYRFMAANYR
ncbi:Protein CBG28047 [Caenorhabditis briggsae]|uniref:Protein CBG28047 n=1 Tax=Caenorhabditis briggsae TaxID=6238 RepID=B6IGN7_CAEBR|nr:Protein CBG28047 [Caenorhabditis briggsae]CAR99067.1 Protein CBG28047 [Caenorhabditis briggsae]